MQKRGSKKPKAVKRNVPQEVEQASAEAKNETLLSHLQADIITVAKNCKAEITAIFNHAKSTPDKKYTAKVSTLAYKLADKYAANGTKIDGYKVSVLTIVNALMVYATTGAYKLVRVTNEELAKPEYRTLKNFYQSVRERRKAKREETGAKKSVPAWKKWATRFFNFSSDEKEKILAFIGAKWTNGKAALKKAA
jgi:hypothetical protein